MCTFQKSAVIVWGILDFCLFDDVIGNPISVCRERVGSREQKKKIFLKIRTRERRERDKFKCACCVCVSLSQIYRYKFFVCV